MKTQGIIATMGITLLAGIQLASAQIGLGDQIVETEVKMKNIDGSMISISEVAGEKGTLVIFSCNHCPYVIGWQDAMVEIGNSYMEKGIGVVFINSNDPAAKGDTFEGMQQMAKDNGYKFPYLVDSDSSIATHFGAKKTPDVFLFDAAGKLVYQGAVGEGGREPTIDGQPWLKDALDALLSGNPIEAPQTKAVGCSIKFR
jgi:peroxiredoxin